MSLRHILFSNFLVVAVLNVSNVDTRYPALSVKFDELLFGPKGGSVAEFARINPAFAKYSPLVNSSFQLNSTNITFSGVIKMNLTQVLGGLIKCAVREACLQTNIQLYRLLGVGVAAGCIDQLLLPRPARVVPSAESTI